MPGLIPLGQHVPPVGLGLTIRAEAIPEEQRIEVKPTAPTGKHAVPWAHAATSLSTARKYSPTEMTGQTTP